MRTETEWDRTIGCVWIRLSAVPYIWKHLKHWQKDGEKSFFGMAAVAAVARIHISILFAYYNGCVNVISTPNCIQLILTQQTHNTWIIQTQFYCTFRSLLSFSFFFVCVSIFFCFTSPALSRSNSCPLVSSVRLFFVRCINTFFLDMLTKLFYVRIRKNHINSHLEMVLRLRLMTVSLTATELSSSWNDKSFYKLTFR